MKEILQYLFNQQTLSKSEAKAIMIEIAQNKFNETEVTAFVSIFLMRSVTLDELEGFREALLNLAIPVDLQTNDLVDIVGTGGDGKNTINISTLASFVVAGAGQKVAKHGNYGASAITGSSNVMEALGYKFKDNSQDLQADLDRADICFMHAPYFHPALKSVGALRKSLGLRTFFNLLGPLLNPVNPQFSVIGVYNLEIARLYQYTLQKQNANFCIVHGLDGYDEISLTGDSKVITKKGAHIYTAEDFGFKTIFPEAIAGGKTVADSAAIFRNILSGKGTDSQNSVVIANAALALFQTDKFENYQNALAAATESLVSGKALEKLDKIIN